MAAETTGWSILEKREPISPGSFVLDGWEIKKKLGQGGFGSVYLAEKSVFGITEQAAIKVIRVPTDPQDIAAMKSEGMSDTDVRTELRQEVDRAVREIRTMLALKSHPCTVKCEGFDVFQYEDDETWDIFIRMEYLKPLTDWAGESTASREAVLQMGISLADLLEKCRQREILHRDIKPSNIFVDPNISDPAEKGFFKLGDFGLAKAVSGQDSFHSKMVGTDVFMAPEAARGEPNDHRSDLYSLGLVLYWMLNQRQIPFYSAGSVSRRDAIAIRVSGKPLPPIPGIDEALNSIILKACKPEADKRWQTAGEFGAALADYQQNKENRKKQEEAAKKRKKKRILIAGIAVLTALAVCLAAIQIGKENKYQEAGRLAAAGKYDEAIALYSAISGYRDADGQIIAVNTMIAEAEEAAAVEAARKAAEEAAAEEAARKAAEEAAAAEEARKERIKSFKTAGNTVEFGSYEQDNRSENGKESIEWIVLDVQDNRSLLLSKYGLDAQPYNNIDADVTWETCSLRKWLNETFLQAAFTADEQAAILTVNVDNSSSQGNSDWDTSGGNDTRDKLFLLSVAEAKKYLNVTGDGTDNITSRASPTDFAVAAGAFVWDDYKTAEGKAAGWWWLRSPGLDLSYAAHVHGGGSLYDRRVNLVSGCVRPAFWINLESDIF